MSDYCATTNSKFAHHSRKRKIFRAAERKITLVSESADLNLRFNCAKKSLLHGIIYCTIISNVTNKQNFQSFR